MKAIFCGRCTICCTEPIIPMNDIELKTIMKATGLPAKNIVAFYPFDLVDWPEDSEDWIELRQERRIMCLRRLKGRCLFLRKRGCLIYKHRPRVCRLFPVDIELDDDCSEYKIEIQERIDKCNAIIHENPEEDKSFIGVARALCRIDVKYFKKVAKWNAYRSGGSTDSFLSYLKLP